MVEMGGDRAWLACAITLPSGTRSATHSAPFSKPPLPMNSMYHTSPVLASEIEKPSMSEA